jgi:hypothetical protein
LVILIAILVDQILLNEHQNYWRFRWFGGFEKTFHFFDCGCKYLIKEISKQFL